MSDSRVPELAPSVRQIAADAMSKWENELLAEGTQPAAEDARAYGEHALIAAVGEVNRALLNQGQLPLDDKEKPALLELVRSKMFGQGRIDELLSDPETENIVANGCDHVWITKTGGRREQGPPLADSDEELEELIQRLARTAGNSERRFDDAQPFLDLRLADGSRLHAIKGVTSRPSLSIRKHRHLTVTFGELVRLGTVSQQLAHTLACAVRPPLPCSIVVAGGTDTGKTTFARGLISEIPPTSRIVVVEDNAELGLQFDPERAAHVVEMEVRQPNIEGVGGIGMDVLGRQALRMRPDRLIIGECRSGYEVRTMLEAMNSGHEGSLTTVHADSSLSALTKLQTLALTGGDSLEMEASARLISLVLHLVVHLTKMPDGRRTVSSVREVTGVDRDTLVSQEVFAFDENAGLALPTASGFSERMLERLVPAGFDRRVLQTGAPV